MVCVVNLANKIRYRTQGQGLMGSEVHRLIHIVHKVSRAYCLTTFDLLLQPLSKSGTTILKLVEQVISLHGREIITRVLATPIKALSH